MMGRINAITESVPGAGPAGSAASVAADAVERARRDLEAVALDLRWAWHREARQLFAELDPDAWAASGHNPVALLSRLQTRRLEAVLRDPANRERLDRVVEEFAAARAPGGRWCDERHPHLTPGVGLFSAEFALVDCLPISAGGLGAVAGEHLKTSSALGVPVTGVGLLYGEASHQWLDARGGQHETWEPLSVGDRPVTLARDRMRFPVEVKAPMPDGPARARVWRAAIGRSRLLLLDTAVVGNPPAQREITRRIYPSDPDTRLRQYIVLGIAGYRALVALGLEPRVVHCNEGHTAFAALARVSALMERHDLTFDEARVAAAPGIVFTTHTPVAAGHDYFAPVLAERYVRPVAAELGIDPDALLALGRHEPDDPDDSFCPTVLALRLAGNRNAVSALHAEVTRQMWRGLWPRVPLPEVPIGHVTNGVHLPSWVAPETSELLADALGTGLEGDGGEPLPWGRVRELEPERVWAARCAQRQRLVERSRSWLTLQGVRRGNRAVVPDPEGRLDPDALTIGFVGRFVAYKRPTLFLTDQTRLRRIMSDDARPVQIVFAGRAHPTDYAGKALLREVVAFARREGLAHRLVFLEDFDIAMDHWLSQGVDLWLNTPRRPDEACGIAGMKAGINGALNFSTVDGWWDEVWRAPTPSEIPLGWAIGGREPFGATTDQDHFDAASFYDVLEHEVVPAFYERDQDGTPLGWVAMVQESIARLGNLWTSSRMVREYTDSYYAPGAARAARLTERRAVGARSVARHLARLAAEWPGVAVADVQVRRVGDGGARVLASVSLGALSPRDVSVEVWIDRPDGRAGPGPAPMTPLSRPGDGHRVYETRLAPALVPEGAIVAARVLPRHRALDDPMSTGLIAWSS